jgi:hypothetical protein
LAISAATLYLSTTAGCDREGWRHGLSDTVRCTNGDRGVDQDGSPLEPAGGRTLDVSAPRFNQLREA